jgi:Ca2+-binding EF-hand superfamily protein
MTSPINKEQIGILAKNRDIIKVVFEFLDSDGDGTIGYDEWKVGIELLNKQLDANEKVYDARELFNSVDVDGSGSIDINAFSTILGSL